MADGRASQHHRLEDGYSLGAGARIGAYVDPLPRWRVHAYARALGSFAGDHDTPRAAGLENRVTLARDLALRLDFSRNREHGRLYNAAGLSLLWYLCDAYGHRLVASARHCGLHQPVLPSVH